MSSVHQRIPWAFEANYAPSNAVRTPINRAAWETPQALAQLLKLIPYGRIGELPDVANSVLFLASDLSDYVTGATLYIDGGMALYPAFRGNG